MPDIDREDEGVAEALGREIGRVKEEEVDLDAAEFSYACARILACDGRGGGATVREDISSAVYALLSLVRDDLRSEKTNKSFSLL